MRRLVGAVRADIDLFAFVLLKDSNPWFARSRPGIFYCRWGLLCALYVAKPGVPVSELFVIWLRCGLYSIHCCIIPFPRARATEHVPIVYNFTSINDLLATLFACRS